MSRFDVLPVVVDDCSQPVGDGENGRLLKLRANRFLNEFVRLVVNAGCGFVHYDHL